LARTLFRTGARSSRERHSPGFRLTFATALRQLREWRIEWPAMREVIGSAAEQDVTNTEFLV